MGKYLYCIIQEKRPRKFDISGIEGEKVYTVHEGSMAVVVSDTTKKDGEYLITRDYTIAHQRVLEGMMGKGYDILPISFGTVADSDSLIKEKLLRERRSEFDKAFAYINGKIELNLKVLWNDIASVFRELAKESGIVRRAKQASGHGALGRFQAANVGEMVKKTLDVKRTKAAERVISQLKPLAVDTRSGEILQDAMVCNETFLVPKNLGKEYDKRIRELARSSQDKMNFVNYGPLPPYNFVSIRVSFKE
jgi:hypothetical protein